MSLTADDIKKAADRLREAEGPQDDAALFVMQAPPPARWQWTLTDATDVQFRVPTAPNWFHRLMQRLCLGIVWRRL